jgi:hypothetical protein
MADQGKSAARRPVDAETLKFLWAAGSCAATGIIDERTGEIVYFRNPSASFSRT